MRSKLTLLLLLCALAACGRTHDAETDNERASAPAHALERGVELDAKAARAIDVAVAPLAATEHARVVDAFAQVIDPQPLSQLVADWQAAAAAAQASATAATRARALFNDAQNLSRQAAEAAESQAAQDRARADALARRLASEWGGPFAHAPDAALLASLAAGTASLVRIEPPAGIAKPGGELRFRALEDETAVALETPWVAPQVTPGRVGASWLAVARERAFPAGTRGRATIASAERVAGVVVPRAAVVLAESRAWAYVVAGANRYERREVAIGAPVDDGYFVASGFAAGESVVVRGAGVLLAQELGSGQEEDDD